MKRLALFGLALASAAITFVGVGLVALSVWAADAVEIGVEDLSGPEDLS